jgi:hypothetical protein
MIFDLFEIQKIGRFIKKSYKKGYKNVILKRFSQYIYRMQIKKKDEVTKILF